MTGRPSILHIARVTIEAQGPLSIGGDTVDPEIDLAVQRDANGLPAISGATLAGSLRHRRAREFEEGVRDHKYGRLFGWTAKDVRELNDDGPVAKADRKRAAGIWQASRLTVTWAHIHDARDHPVDGLVTDRDRLKQDPILGPMLDPVPARRDHVGLDSCGVADERKKYDRSFVPPGYRFTFELRLWTDTDREVAEWDEIERLLASPFWRLGGATRRGYGRIAVRPKGFRKGRFDLAEPKDYRRFMLHHPRLDVVPELLETKELPPDSEGASATLELRPDDFVRFGSGDRLLGHHADRDEAHNVDMLLLTMPRVHWPEEGEAELQLRRHLLVPASAIKGALAHRFRFHLLAARSVFADDLAAGAGREAVAALAASCDGDLEEIFGSANAEAEDGKATGRAGRLYLDDQLIPLDDVKGDLGLQAHNSIDRFSGAVRRGVLFSEELLFRPQLAVPIRLDPPRDLEPERTTRLMDCLTRALADLVEGRLAIGAGGSKGHGYCTGTIEPADWLARKPG